MNVASSGGYALLDDGSLKNAEDERRSRLYTDLERELVCCDPAQLSALCADAETAVAAGLHAALLCDYDFGVRLQGVKRKTDPTDFQGCLRILLFKQRRLLTDSETTQWLAAQDAESGNAEPAPAGICSIHHGVTRPQYDEAIASIQQWLQAGDCYQINYTYPIHFRVFGSLFALYRRLRARQPAPYGALIGLPDGQSILSCSPELFLQHLDGRLTARPMKGTAAAGHDAQEAQTSGAILLADPKNRAENLMIVDLLRNDLGRIAETGSVQVPTLFSVERFGDVLQMTSTVEARPRSDVGLADVLRALFPCGSITGAPKLRAMELIRQIEQGPRKLYTGAIGWLDAPQEAEALGQFCLSVAIRTLELSAPDAVGMRAGQMGVGGGIVIDSLAESEYAECALKARFLTGLDPGFQLFETMYATRAGCRFLPRHLARLQNSADYFGFKYDESEIRAALDSRCDRLGEQACRLRLSLSHDGTFTLTQALLVPHNEPVQLLLVSEPTNSNDLFLRHKTTLRSRYDQAWQEAEQQGAFDTLFFNERDELTEGARSNVFVKLSGIWYTPPLVCGVLPGVMRAVLLDNAQDGQDWRIEERVLTRWDLMNAQAIRICNALRGVLPAVLKQLDSEVNQPG